MKKRLLSMLLVVCMLLSMLPTAVFATDGWTSASSSLSTDVQKVVTIRPSDYNMESNAPKTGETWFYWADGVNVGTWQENVSVQLVYSKTLTLENSDNSATIDLTDVKATVLVPASYSFTLPSSDDWYEVNIDGATSIYAGGSEVQYTETCEYRAYVPETAEGTWTAVFQDQAGLVYEIQSGITLNTPATAPTGKMTAGGTVLDWDVTETGTADGQVVVFTATYATYSVTLDVQNAFVTGVDVNRKYEENEAITYYAYPMPGFELPAGVTEGENTITVRGNTTITVRANAIPVTPPDTYVVSLATVGSGTAAISGADKVAAGETVYITITPKADYRVDTCTVQAGGIDVPYTETSSGISFEMPAEAVTVTVTFADTRPQEYTITADNSAANVTIQADTKATEGDTVEFTVEPEDGYTVAAAYVEGEDDQVVPVSVKSITDGTVTYAFTMPDYDVTIHAQAQEKAAETYLVQYLYEDGSIYGFEYVESGKTVTLPAVTEAGYTVKWQQQGNPGVTYDGGAQSQPVTADTSFTMVKEAGKYNVTNKLLVDGAESAGATTPGSITTAITEVEVGQTVSFAVAVNTGAYLQSVAVMAAGDVAVDYSPVKVEQTDVGYTYTYQFVMPASDVTISAYLVTELEGLAVVKFVDAANGTVYDVQLVSIGSTVTAPADPSKTGYTFQGWYEDLGCQLEFDFTDEIVEDTTVYAGFEAVQCTLTFDSDGGDAVADVEAGYGETATLPGAPSKANATFAGWQDTASGLVYQAGGNYKVTGDASFKALWNAELVTVTFKDADGSLIDTMTVSKGTEIPTPQAPEKAGKKFAGWYDGATTTVADKVTATADVTYTATYTDEAYTLTFDAADNITDQTYGALVTLPDPKDTPEGKTFVGWKDTATSLVYEAGAQFQVTGNASFEAVWSTKDVTIKFVADGVVVDFAMVSYGDEVIAPAAPTKEGHDFQNWALGDTTVTAGGRIQATEDATYTAVYQVRSYLVQYHADGGAPAPGAENAEFGQTITLAAAPTKEGYTFIGWQSGADGLTYSAGANYVVTEAVIFTARWEKDDAIIVKFVDPDGFMYDWFYVDSGENVTAPKAPVKEGFAFQGWHNDTYGLVAANGEKEITGAPGEVVVFTAQWEGAEYTLHIQAKNASGELNADGQQLKIPDASVAQISAGETIELSAQANQNCAITEVYYTMVGENNVTTKVVVTPDENGNYVFTMPAAEAWLHIVAEQNVFSITTAPDSNTDMAVNGNQTSAEVGDSVNFWVAGRSDYSVDSVYVTYTDAAGKTKYITPTYLSTDAEGHQWYTFTMPAANAVIHGSSVIDKYTVTVLDYDNDLLGVLTVDSGSKVDLNTEYAALLNDRDGYTFAGWEYVYPAAKAGVTFINNDTKVEENIVVRAVYTADEQLVYRADDCSENLDNMTVSDGKTMSSVNFASADAYASTVRSATGNTVQISVKPKFDYIISGVAVRGKDSNTVASLDLKSYDKVTGIYVYEFTMPAEDVEVAVYTEAKTFNVQVTENPDEGGTYTINGYTTTNLPVKQGETAVIDVTAADGWYVDSYSVYYYDTQKGNQLTYVNDLNGNPINQVDPDAAEVQISFKMVSYDVTVEVNYAKTVYTVTPLDAEHGTIGVSDKNPAEFVYGVINAKAGDKIRVELKPDTGYEPDRDTVLVKDANGNSIPVNYDSHNGATYIYEFTMPASNVTVSCEFQPLAYQVIAEKAYTGGKVYVGDTNTNVDSFEMDAEASVEVIPEAGYRIKEETKTVTEGTTTVTVTAPYFVLKNVNGEELYNSIDAALEAKLIEELGSLYTPGTYYVPIIDVIETEQGDGSILYTFQMPDYDVYVDTDFEKIDYTVDVETTNTENTDYGTVYVGKDVRSNATSETNIAAQVEDAVYVKVEAKDGYVLKSLIATYVNKDGRVVELPLNMLEQKYDNHKVYWKEYLVKFDMPAADVTITAEYVKDYYSVVFKDWDGTQLAIQTIDYLNNPTLLKAADITGREGYHFVGWVSEDTDPQVTTPSTTDSDFVIVRDTVITAVYEKDTYNIVYTAGANGSFADDKTTSAEYQQTCAFTVVPDQGYMVDEVTAYYINEAGLRVDIDLKEGASKELDQAGTTSIRYAFNMPACKDGTAVQVSATFKAMSYNVSSNYIKADGEIRLNGGDTDYVAASYTDTITVDVKPVLGMKLTDLYYTYANPDTGAEEKVSLVDQITDLVAGGSATFTMPASDVAVYATFEEITYTITDATTDTNGTVTITEPDVAYRDTASFTVTPNEGYQIETVTATYQDENGKDQTISFSSTPADLTVGGDYTFVMPAANVTVVATFTEIAYLVTVDLTGEAEVRLDGNVTDQYSYDFGETVTVTVTPADGWEIQSVTAGDLEVTPGEDGTYTFTMPAHDVTVDIVVVKTGYTVSTKITGEADGGTITLSQEIANVGDNVTAVVQANYGYELVNVSIQGESGKVYNVDRVEGDTYYFTMPAENVTVIAEFAKHEYTVVFKDYDGKVLKTEYVPYMGSATAPATPEREGYTFKCWDTPFLEVTKDLVVTAVYVINEHTVDSHAISFTGAEHGVITVENGASANYGDKIVFTADPDDGWRVQYVSVITKGGEAVPVSIVGQDAYYRQSYTFVMPDDDVKITVAFKMAASSYFTDVRTDDWFYEAVMNVADRGYFEGIDTNIFAPQMNMTRAMFVTVLGRIAGVDVSQYAGDSEFSDVVETAYYAPYVEWATENKIVKGFPEGTFKPDDDITREQMAAMMRRFCAYLGISTEVENENWMDRYTDADKIGDWAVEDMSWAVGVGLMKGRSDTTIDPIDLATRAEVAQVIKNFCDKVLFQ